jgi:hypothetical protein
MKLYIVSLSYAYFNMPYLYLNLKIFLFNNFPCRSTFKISTLKTIWPCGAPTNILFCCVYWSQFYIHNSKCGVTFLVFLLSYKTSFFYSNISKVFFNPYMATCILYCGELYLILFTYCSTMRKISFYLY